MSALTQGRRIECPFAADGGLIGEDWPVAGDYWFYPAAGWQGMTPNGLLAGLTNHGIIEHEDRTITVSPSILTQEGGKRDDSQINVGGPNSQSWHGFLERGVWREC